MAVKVVISIIGKPILRKEGRGDGGRREDRDGGSKKETGGRRGRRKKGMGGVRRRRGKEEGDSRLLKHF